MADQELQGEIGGKAELLLKFLGDVELAGKIKTARKDIFSKYPNADKLRTNAYFQYQFCVNLMNDDSLTHREKREELKNIYREFFKPVSVRDSNSGLQRFWLSVGGVGFDCDLDLPWSELDEEKLKDIYSRAKENLGKEINIASRYVISLALLSGYQYKTIFFRGEAVKNYGCRIENSSYQMITQMTSTYRNSDGQKCAKFINTSNHPEFEDWISKSKDCCVDNTGKFVCLEGN